MATENMLRSITVPAAADLSANQYRFVTINTSGQAALTTTLGGTADGVLQNDPSAQAMPGTVAVAGVSKVVAGAAITNGDTVSSDTVGRAITAITGQTIHGKALQAATAAGQIISVLLKLGAESVKP